MVVAPHLQLSLPAPTATLLNVHSFWLCIQGISSCPGPTTKVYMITFICVEQTCLLRNAAEHDKRSLPGILGTVQELREERLWVAPLWLSPWGDVGRAGVHSAHGGCISENLCHLGRCSCAGSCKTELCSFVSEQFPLSSWQGKTEFVWMLTTLRWAYVPRGLSGFSMELPSPSYLSEGCKGSPGN